MGLDGLISYLDPDYLASVNEMLEGFLRRVIEQNKLDPAQVRPQYGWRFIRPDDQILGSTALTYNATYASGTAVNLLNIASYTRVPVGLGVVHFGWYSSINFEEGGYFSIQVNSVKKDEVPAKSVWSAPNPPHAMIMPSSVVFVKENDLVEWKVYQVTGASIAGVVWPWAFLLGPKKQLNID